MSLTYAIVDVATDLDNIDWDQVVENGPSTLRRSTDQSLFLIKYYTEPTFITSGLVVPSETMDHLEMLTEMHTPEWIGV
jgi:hypothetical protein|tara:strand:- start:2478 stop:2714 length:237 start_codon:yes stop_codon:yes gene_type:complete